MVAGDVGVQVAGGPVGADEADSEEVTVEAIAEVAATAKSDLKAEAAEDLAVEDSVDAAEDVADPAASTSRPTATAALKREPSGRIPFLAKTWHGV